MISKQQLAQWKMGHPWPFDDQVEQDLLLSQAMCSIANDSLLSEELILRGGTAFHKLFLPAPLRYSEDLDYVRTNAGGIGNVMKALTAIGQRLGYEVRTKMGMYPKVYWRYTSQSGSRAKIKVEINTYERAPMMGTFEIPFSVNSDYFSGSANIKTFHPEELVATKIRALYQRSKGRDLFDVWLALTSLRLEPAAIIEAFPAYRPEGLTSEDAVENLTRKLEDIQFRRDINVLGKVADVDYDIETAGKYVLENLISLI